MNRTISRDNEITVDGIDARYTVTKVDDGYTFSVNIASRALGDVIAARGFFQRSTSTVGMTAERLAIAAVQDVIAQSEREFVYVVINDMPGFAARMLGEHIRAGYRGNRAAGPLYVVRCDDAAQAEETVDRVRGIGTIVDGSRSFSPTVNNITNHALDALDGSVHNAVDPLTFLAAKRAADAVVHGIGD